jgi:colicin import membrane protein
MTKLYLLLFALLLHSCAPSAYVSSASAFTSVSPTFYYAVVPVVSLYEKPTSTTEKITITKGDKVLVVGHQAPNWYILKIDGVTYYAAENLFTANAPVPAPVVNLSMPGNGGSAGNSHDVQTGPRGGRYYINKNGNKTYIKRK